MYIKQNFVQRQFSQRPVITIIVFAIVAFIAVRFISGMVQAYRANQGSTARNNGAWGGLKRQPSLQLTQGEERATVTRPPVSFYAAKR